MSESSALDVELTRFKTNPVVVSDQVLLGRIETLNRKIPISREHRRAFNELGSEFTYAREVSGHDCSEIGFPNYLARTYLCLVRLHSDIESGIGVFREVPVVYSPQPDLQGRYVRSLPDLLRILPAARQQIERHLFFVSVSVSVTDEQVKQLSSPHARLVRLPASSPAGSSAETVIRSLASTVYSTDLYAREGYVVGEDFFGRSETLRRIQSNVRLKKVAGLMGLRKSGKTSLIKQLINEAADETIYIYEDLESVESIRFGNPIPALIRSLCGYAIGAIKGAGGWVQALAEYTEAIAVGSKLPTLDDFSEALRSTISNRRNQDKMFVLVLDEIEHLVPYDLDTMPVAEAQDAVARFFSILRSLWQSNDNFTFILSGVTGSPFERAELYGRSNPLFRIADVVWISALSRAESDELLNAIGLRQGMIWHRDAQSLAFDATGGHPLLLRQLGSVVFSELPKERIRAVEISGTCVETAVGKFRQTSASDVDQIVHFVERFYPDGFAVLRALREGLSTADAEDFDPGSMGRLQNLGLISLVDGGWVASPLLSLSKEFRNTSFDTTMSPTQADVDRHLAQGEGYHVEFKASYAVDLDRDGQVPADTIKWGCLKTILSFLNSGGGVLLVGVRDDGSVGGLAPDLARCGSADRFIRDVQTLLNAQLGGGIASVCKLHCLQFGDSDEQVLVITVPQWSAPCFLAKDFSSGKKSSLYVRNNARTDALDGAELVAYLAKR